MAQGIQSYCACPTPEIINIPGVEGSTGGTGTNGTNGTDGSNAFTTVSSSFVVPDPAATPPSNQVTISVVNSSWMVVGQNIFVAGAGYFQVASIPNSLSVVGTFLKYTGNSANIGNTIPVGAGVSPAGTQPKISGVSGITDNSTGTSGTAVAGTVGIEHVGYSILAVDIVTGTIMSGVQPGYAFKILSFDARCNDQVTTAGRSSNLNLSINGVALTGGVIGLSGTYTIGQAQPGSAITGGATGNAGDSISIVANTVTAFAQGSFMLYITIQNMDTANAFASILNRLNALITGLS